MIDWSTVALTFPGQGSQQIGMGADLVAKYPAAAKVYEEADQILGFSLSKLCFEGPPEALDKTINTQPALYVTGIAILRALETIYGKFQPLAAAGHSLGEFTALTAVGALPFVDGVRLVRQRGVLMTEAGEANNGGMAALLGMETNAAREVCEQASAQTGRPVVISNDNCPGQIVISGADSALEAALVLAKEKGAKRAVRLAVSIAAHSPLMLQATSRFHDALATAPFAAPQIPVIGNGSAARLTTPAEILTELDSALTSPVRWTESVQALIGMGVKTFLELGPKDVLTGFLKRIDRSATGITVNSVETLTGLE
jgi:[acyl-carrier-protein] S-malonyltransferase